MRTYLALFLLLITVAANAANYEAGQVWSYHHRPDDDGSTVIIDRVESVPNLGTIYHVSVLQVHVKDSTGSIRLIDLPHCPVSSTTLDTSLVALIGKHAPYESYMQGYTEWRQAFDAGHAGVYTIPLSEIVATLESMFNHGGQSR
jgi:hypothetical protein